MGQCKDYSIALDTILRVKFFDYLKSVFFLIFFLWNKLEIMKKMYGCDDALLTHEVLKSM